MKRKILLSIMLISGGLAIFNAQAMKKKKNKKVKKGNRTSLVAGHATNSPRNNTIMLETNEKVYFGIVTNHDTAKNKQKGLARKLDRLIRANEGKAKFR